VLEHVVADRREVECLSYTACAAIPDSSSFTDRSMRSSFVLNCISSALHVFFCVEVQAKAVFCNSYIQVFFLTLIRL